MCPVEKVPTPGYAGKHVSDVELKRMPCPASTGQGIAFGI
jgi:hypothetical protein